MEMRLFNHNMYMKGLAVGPVSTRQAQAVGKLTQALHRHRTDWER